ncbi:uncharacterized protein LOC127881076 [Dreissena polymorpha]|uniref:Uncharacterized protein n=1 Tax=Dreissena polymorpha TaxID=45954 RepID=A0A9D4GUC4_DREPO|nr:uncharacterized protein LOC127881076 [Dreissena polymorpha]KAH3823831.1 hypothetical protein DPMN_125654 [Dreissena polymorpha]
MMVGEKKRLIKGLIEKKYHVRLFVAVKSIFLETANMKTKLRNIDHNNHIEQICFKPNDALQKILFRNNAVIGTLQETIDGSEEYNDVQVEDTSINLKPNQPCYSGSLAKTEAAAISERNLEDQDRCVIGDEPPGTMIITRESLRHCVGYENVGKICIHYSFKEGIQAIWLPLSNIPGKSD